jgi:RHS repeat-associated protein
VANRILGGLDLFFSRTDATGGYAPITDALGSVLALTNSGGTITTQYGYDPYGNSTSYGGMSSNTFQFAGRENDGNGLYFYRARYYSPTFGRFVSEDPLGFGGGGFNSYEYANDAPVAFVDPTGLKTTVIVVQDTVGQYTAGTHSAVYIDNNGDAQLYDPAGGYATDHGCGSGDICTPSENGMSLPGYINYQLSHGSAVDTYTFPTTPEEEAAIANNMSAQGGGMPGLCTLAVCDVVRGIGPFKNLPPSLLPGSLGHDLAGRACETTHYGPKPRWPRPMGPIIFPPLGGWR